MGSEMCIRDSMYIFIELGVRKLNPIGLSSMAADSPGELKHCGQKEK